MASVLEAARLILKLERRPARTVRVVLFANEEFWLSGAREYARLAGSEIANHVLGMEADLGVGPVWRLESQVAPAALASIEAMRKALLPLSLEAGGNQAHGGADLGPLRTLGMPGLGLSHDASRYFDNHHTVNDTLAKVDGMPILAADLNAMMERIPPMYRARSKTRKGRSGSWTS